MAHLCTTMFFDCYIMVYYPKGVSGMKEWFHRHRVALMVTGLVLGSMAVVFIVVFCIVIFGMDTGLSQLLKLSVGQ